MCNEKKKQCTICEQWKPRNAFSRHATQAHKLEYCFSCQTSQGDQVLIYNASKFAIDRVNINYADKLVLAGFLQYNRGRYVIVEEALYREQIKFMYPAIKTEGFVLALGKYDEKRKRVMLEKAEELVAEGACVWEGEHLRHLFSGKELAEVVLDRDKNVCHYCHGLADRITFLLPRSQGGNLSPQNSVAVCRSCKDMHGENLYFFKWLNVPVLKDETRGSEENVYIMWDKEKQTQFFIQTCDAKTLLEEKMATIIDERTIHILHNQKEFWDFIRERDEWICHYCGKYGNTVDHIVPKSKGGMSTPLNCVCACTKCNEKKSSLEKEEFIKKTKK